MELNKYLNNVEISFLSTIFVNPNEWIIENVEKLNTIGIETITCEHPAGLQFKYTRQINS